MVVVRQDWRSRMWTRSREQFRPRENFHSHSQLTLGRTSSKSSSAPRSLPTHISPNTLSLLALILPKHSHYLWWRSISLGIWLHSHPIEGFQWARADQNPFQVFSQDQFDCQRTANMSAWSVLHSAEQSFTWMASLTRNLQFWYQESCCTTNMTLTLEEY